jgi:hypothetical protein
MADGRPNDAMLMKYDTELQERNAAVQGMIRVAQEQDRDLNASERENLNGHKERIVELRSLTSSPTPRSPSRPTPAWRKLTGR